MSTRTEIRQMTKAKLKAWLTDKNERLPGDERTKNYYVQRAMNVFERLRLSDEDDSDSSNNNNSNNSPLKNAIRKRRQSVQDGFSSGASGGSTGSRKKPISRRSRSRRTSTESGTSNNNNNKKIVKTRRKTPVRKVNSNSSNRSSVKENNSKNENTGSRSKRVAKKVKTQHKESPALSNSIKRTRNRMRRATDNPMALQDAINGKQKQNNNNNNNNAGMRRINRLVDSSETDSDNDNDNFNKYFIDFEPKQLKIIELKKWLTSHNIEYSSNPERKAYYVNLVSKYTTSKDDTFNRNNKNNKHNLSPKYNNRSHMSPSKRAKIAAVAASSVDSPPLPPNLDPSPLTPPDVRLAKNRQRHNNSRSPKRYTNQNNNNNRRGGRGGKRRLSDNDKDIRMKYQNSDILDNNDDDDDDDDDEAVFERRRKHGLLNTPALLKKSNPVVTDSSRAAMRNEIQKMLESSDNEGNDPISNKYRVNLDNDDEEDEEEEDEDNNDDSDDENEDEDDETSERTRKNTLLNQYLGSQYYNDKLKREEKKKQKQLAKQRAKEQAKAQAEAQAQAARQATAAKQSSMKSPFSMLSSFMNRISPRINRFSNNNNNNNGAVGNIGVGGVVNGAPPQTNVRHRLKYSDDELDAMSPAGNINSSRNNDTNIGKHHLNSSEEPYLRSDEENIPTDPDSPSPPPMAFVPDKAKQKRNNRGGYQLRNRGVRDSSDIPVIQPSKGRGRGRGRPRQQQQQQQHQQLEQRQEQQRHQDNREEMIKNHPLPSNYSKQGHNINKQKIKKKKNTCKLCCGWILSVFAVIIGLFVAILVGYVLIDAFKSYLDSKEEFEWFCDVNEKTVNGRLYNEITGKACYPCPSSHNQFCQNGRAFCEPHYRISGKLCVLDSKTIQIAHDIELKSRKILSQYKGRAECGEDIEPGLSEKQLKAYVQTTSLKKITNSKDFEDGWKYFISNVLSDGSVEIEYNKNNKRYYSINSSKTPLCELTHFLFDHAIIVITTIIIIIIFIRFYIKYKYNKECNKIAKEMRSYTYELLYQQKLKNPSYKAVSQIKQDNIYKFGNKIGKSQEKRERIWEIVKDKFERDEYIQCSQRTVDGIQKLCWQMSDMKSPNYLNRNNNGNSNNTNTNNNNIDNNNNNNMKFNNLVEETPLTRHTMSSVGVAAVAGSRINNNSGTGIRERMDHVYGVPINHRQQKHSVTSPSRSFGMTPIIPRNRGRNSNNHNIGHMNNNNNNNNMPLHSRYNPWG